MESAKQRALQLGRPTNSICIFVIGLEGAGKSTLIKNLFSFHSSQLTEVNIHGLPSIIRKSVNIPELQCRKAQNFSVIEFNNLIPNNPETAVNIFFNELSECGDIVQRHLLGKSQSDVASSVYPNVFVFTIMATENRIRGTHSPIRIFLEHITRTHSIVDQIYPNLIVVVTHACNLGLDKDSFAQKLQELKEQISSVVLDVCGIKDVCVVPIESRPEAYNLEVVDGVTALPNKEKTPLNIMHAMLNLATRERDELLKSSLQQLLTAERDLDFTTPAAYQPTVLGFGFCAVKEEFTPFSLFSENENENKSYIRVLAGHPLRFKGHIKVHAVEPRHNSCPSKAKEMYEDMVKTSHSLENRIPLKHAGQLVSRSLEDKETSIKGFSLQKGYLLGKLELDIQNEHFRKNEFWSLLKNLPSIYNGTTMSTFRDFFNVWGTHVVSETCLGGCFELTCSINDSTIQEADILKTLHTISESLFQVENSVPKIRAQLKSIGAFNERVYLKVGDLKNIIDVIEMKKTKLRYDEIHSIKSNPVNLRQVMKLCPYYSFLADPDKMHALQEATREYVSGKPQKSSKGYDLVLRKSISEIAVNCARKFSESDLS